MAYPFSTMPVITKIKADSFFMFKRLTMISRLNIERITD